MEGAVSSPISFLLGKQGSPPTLTTPTQIIHGRLDLWEVNNKRVEVGIAGADRSRVNTKNKTIKMFTFWMVRPLAPFYCIVPRSLSEDLILLGRIWVFLLHRSDLASEKNTYRYCHLIWWRSWLGPDHSIMALNVQHTLSVPRVPVRV